MQVKLSDGSQKAEDEVTIFIDAREANREFSGDLAVLQDSSGESREENVQVPETETQQTVRAW